MPPKSYRIIFNKFVKNTDENEVKQKLAESFNTELQVIEQLFATRPVIFKKYLDYEAARRYKQKLEHLGVICLIDIDAPYAHSPVLPTQPIIEHKQHHTLSIISIILTITVALFFGYLIFYQNIGQVTETKVNKFTEEIRPDVTPTLTTNQLQIQLEAIKQQQKITQQNNSKLITKIQLLQTKLEVAQTQQQQTEKLLADYRKKIEIIDDENCQHQLNVDEKFFFKSVEQTISKNREIRFQAFTTVMHNLDYIDIMLQQQVIAFYLKHLTRLLQQKNENGIYYATFIMSELTGKSLKVYQAELEKFYTQLENKRRWEKTLYRYCKIKRKIATT